MSFDEILEWLTKVEADDTLQSSLDCTDSIGSTKS